MPGTRTARSAAVRATAVGGVLLSALVMAAPAADAVTVKTVTMTNSRTFYPGTVTVSPSTVVTWKNGSFISHTTTSNTGLWSARVAPGQTFSRTFSKVGTSATTAPCTPG